MFLRCSPLCRLLIVGLALSNSSALLAGPIFIPSDLAVSLTAEPSGDLEPGDIVSFTISITNNGPEPVDRFALQSSPIVDEIDVLSGSIDCDDHLFVTVADFGSGFYYTYIWQLAFPGEPPLQVGETRHCRFSDPYTEWAPPEFPVTFSPGTAFSDLDPSNDIATVVLRGATRGVATTPVPTLSSVGLATLIALMALVGAWPILSGGRRK